jgi:hypothetical protein
MMVAGCYSRFSFARPSATAQHREMKGKIILPIEFHIFQDG